MTSAARAGQRDEDAGYVVVGAGSAGCVLASRLSAGCGERVVLVEAGGPASRAEIAIPAAFPTLFGSSCDWDYRTTAQPGLAGRALRWPRGKVLGGSSSLNAQIWTRGHRADYDGWAAAGCAGWGMDDVAPYFQRAEGREGGDAGGAAGYGTDGPTRIEDLRDPSPATTDFLAACAAAGLPPLGDGEMPARGGAGPVRATQRNGRRWSSADAYLRRPQENLSVITGCHVTRVLIEGSRAVGIEYRTGQGSFRIAAAREVIIAAGAVGSPQLLMLSGIGDADHLRAQGIGVQSHSPEVGRNLGDHLYLPLAFAAREPVSPGIGDMSGEIARYVRERRGRLTSNIAEAVAFLRSSDEVTAPDLEFVWMLLPFLGRGEPTDHGVTLGVVLLRPASSGQIRLRSADPHVHPVIDPGYLSDAGREDLRVLTAGVRRAGEVLRQPALSRWLGAPLTPEPARDGPEATQSLIRSGAETLFHPVGTCRMGAEPGTVLDLQFRVRGVAGLRVVDASAMPSIPRGHTHAPTVMLAERAADMILDRAAGRQLPNPRKDVQEQ